MHETAKCYAMRTELDDFRNYLHGQGVDVGCGDAPLKVPDGSVISWDTPQGDGTLLATIPDSSLDFVYSSHCLEHLKDVPLAIQHWTRVLKPGGHLYIVVPDYILYEKMNFPSKFNTDHKASFSVILKREQVKRATHYHASDIEDIFKKNQVRMVDVRVEDQDYDYNKGLIDQTLGKAMAQLCFIGQKR